MVYQNLNEKEIVRLLPRRLAKILPDVKIKKIEWADTNSLWDIGIKIKVGSSLKWLRCEVKAKGEPWYLYQAIGRLTQAPQVKKGDYPVVIVPFISVQGRKVCKEAGIGYIDLSGNIFLKFNSVLVEKTSNEKPAGKVKKKPTFRMPFASKSSRVLRVLLENPKKVWTFPSLSQEAEANIRTAFSVVDILKEKGFIDKKRGAIRLIKPEAMLDYWVENYDFGNNQILSYFSFTRTFDEFLVKLRKLSGDRKFNYALTLHSGAALIASFVRFRDVHLYIQGEAEAWVKKLNLRPVESGGTIHLVIPYDEGVFYNKQSVNNVSVACNTQLYIDLINYPARGKEQADFLREKKMRF